MKNTKAKLTGERRSMVPHGLRIDEDESAILTKTAKRLKTTDSALLRTAWSEYIVNHNLKD